MKRLVPSLAAATTLALALAMPGCTSEPSPWVKPRRQAETDSPLALTLPPPELRVEYGGCATVLLTEGGELQCVYKPGAQLRLWVTHEDGQQPVFAMEGDGAWSMGEPYVLPEELGQGYRIELEGEGLGAVTVALPDRPMWRLALRAVGEMSKEERVAVNEPRKRFVELEKELSIPNLEVLPEVRGLLTRMVEQGHLWSAVQSATAAAYHLTWRTGRPEFAQELLVDVRDQLRAKDSKFEQDYPLGAALIATFLGHTLRRRGQLAEAAREYRLGARVIRRTDSPIHLLDALTPYALVLVELGYFEAAAYWSAQARETASRHARPYDLAQTLAMVAKVSLRLREAHQTFDDPVPRFEEIEEIYGPGGPLAEYREPIEVALSRAESALYVKNPSAALEQIKKLPWPWLTADARAGVQQIRLRALMQQGASPSVVQQALEKLLLLTVDAVGPEVRWKTVVLEGQVFEMLGDVDRSLDAYLQAEALLDRLLPLAALGLPGDYAAARRGSGTNRLISLLLEQGELERAVCTIRRSRARVGQMAMLHRRFDEHSREALSMAISRYNEARLAYARFLEESRALATSDYERARLLATQRQEELEQQTFEILSTQSSYHPSLGCDVLSPRRPGELLLLLYPDGSDLHILTEDDYGLVQHPTLAGHFNGEVKNDDWQSDLLLHPLRQHIARARRVRVLASGLANTIPVHALPWSSDPRDRVRKPLSLDVPVVYGLDLPPSRSPDPPQAGDPTGALTLADGRAEGAESEVSDVASQLRTQGWTVSERVTHELSLAGLRDALLRADHLHYAGHAYYADASSGELAEGVDQSDSRRRWPPYSGGAASEPSYIPLKDDSRLTVSDILMMERVPHTVVLMGCATGVIDDRMTYGGFSLATAFLGAGARAVVASTHEIDGERAAPLGRALYAKVTPEIEVNPGLWMTNALNLVEEGHLGTQDLASYRVYVP